MLSRCILGVCYLCSDVKVLLKGNTYTGLMDDMPASFRENCDQTYPHDIEVPSDVHISDLTMSHEGTLVLVGENIHIENTVVPTAIRVIGESARNIILTNVSCMSEKVAVKFLGNLRFKHGPMNMEGTILSNVNSQLFAAAIAHGSGSVTCNPEHTKILLQPTEPMEFHGCDVRDLSAYFDVFGKNYMVSFFSGEAEDLGRIRFILKISISVAAALVFLTCVQSRTTVKLLIDEYKRTN